MPVLFEVPGIRTHLLPFTYTRHIADLRVGIVTIREKWDHFLNDKCSLLASEKYLSQKYIEKPSDLYINAAVLPSAQLCDEIASLDRGSAMFQQDLLVAVRLENESSLDQSMISGLKRISCRTDISVIRKRWDIFLKNGSEILSDYLWITGGRRSAPISASVLLTGNVDNIFIEDSAYVEGVTLNPGDGKIYIGKGAQLMEGALIRGSAALCDNSVVKMGTRIYGDSTLGPFVKCGGEISNSVIFGYSNKAHDGYLGDSVIGEWCNLGADTNVSNLKNNYNNIKVWDYEGQIFEDSGQQFCGLSMGDHSKCGINTMFNTGSVVGVSANIFGAGFPPKYIPSFSWGGSGGFKEFRFDEARKLANSVMKRRNMELSDVDSSILNLVFQISKKYRDKIVEI